MKLLVSVIFALLPRVCQLQIPYFGDCWQGGVVGDGYTATYLGGASTIQLPIPSGSTVRKAIFFSNIYKWQGNNVSAIDKIIEINGSPLVLSEANGLDNIFFYTIDQFSVETIAVDVTSFIDPTQSIYIIDPLVNVSPIETPLFSDFYIIVLYSNNTMSNTCMDIFFNNSDVGPLLDYSLIVSNQLNNTSEVGLSIFASSICNTEDDWAEIYVDNSFIGQIGGDEYNTIVPCTGVVGSFTYNNMTITGNGNDTGDAFMDSVDAVANIQPYLTNLTNILVGFNAAGEGGEYSNNVNQLYLTYSTNCDTFSVSTPSDTTVCLGSNLQLNASTSNPAAVYEWQPATGLSCTNCPNPIFTADSSMFYTVRIWNNDSCSVVRPLKINVRPRPSFGEIEMMPSECGTSTGSVSASALNGNLSVQTWQELGGNSQTSNVFQNLSAGNHTFYFTDTNGCQSGDTTIFISEINSTIASFSANPSSGAVPLAVEFTNTSSNATNFEWFIDNDFQGTSLPTYTFQNTGIYVVELVAWQFDPNCADTFSVQIIGFDSLSLIIPNVFTPNRDGMNDFFALTSSLPVDVELVILNRWGVEVYKYSGSLQVGLNALWSGVSVTDGTYFYTMKISKNGETPFVKELETPMEKTGFVEVRR